MNHPSKKEILALKLFAEKTAKGAGKILADGFSKPKTIRYKGKIDPVTQFDLMSEKYIIDKITKKYKTHSILAEEGSNVDNQSDYRWVIDPLDGTVNYAHRLPIYCVSIALQFKNETIVGVVYDPEQQELYSSGLGLGASLNGMKIKVSKENKLSRSMLATGFAYNVHTAKINNLGMFSRMAKKAQAVRRLGSAALDMCYVAAGRMEGFWEYYLHPWDTAAAMLIITEAGGKVTKIDTTKYSIFDLDIMASNRHIHNDMKKVLNQTKK